MDLSQLDTTKAGDEGAILEVLHPASGELTDITITMYGRDSTAHQDALKEIRSRRLKEALKDQGRKRGRTKGDVDEATLEAQEDALYILARCTKDWDGVVLDGTTLPCTLDNAIMVYRRFVWLKEQVDAFVGDRANFLSSSPETS